MNITTKKLITLFTLLTVACSGDDAIGGPEDAPPEGSTGSRTEDPSDDDGPPPPPPPPTGETGDPEPPSDEDDDGGSSSSGMAPETAEGTETGAVEPAAVRGRVSVLRLNTRADAAWHGGRIDARYFSDEDLVYGSGAVPEGTCAVWIHDAEVMGSSLNEGLIDVAGATEQTTCANSSSRYLCAIDTYAFADPFAFVSPSPDGTATVGTHLGFLTEGYSSTLARMVGFANAENNGSYEVARHGGVNSIHVYNPEASIESIPDGAQLTFFEGHKAVPLSEFRVRPNFLVAVSKDDGPETNGFDVAIDVGISSAPWFTNFQPLPPKTRGDVSYDCGATGCIYIDETRWVYELQTSNVAATGDMGLARPTGEWASVECRGELGPDITIPGEVFDALDGLDVADWEARLSRVHEEEVDTTIVRAGFGWVDYGH